MISVFRGEEVRAWIDLNETGIPPAMYCFKLEGQRIHIFMEKTSENLKRTCLPTHFLHCLGSN
jgi:hypothetical protein